MKNLICAVTVLAVSTAQADTIYVDVDCPGPGDGTGFFHVVQCVSGKGPHTVLDGFTITGGNADGAFPDSARRWATEGHMGNVGSALFLVRQHQ